MRFSCARVVHDYNACASQLRCVRFAVAARAVCGWGSCGSRLGYVRFAVADFVLT